jgi:hypothetical protein
MVVQGAGERPHRVIPQLTPEKRFTAAGRLLQPSPANYGPLAGRWDAADRDAFCQGAAAPGFADFMVRIRDELLRQIEFTRPETASVVACWIAGTYFHPLFNAYPRLNINGPKRAGKSKTLQVIAAVAFNGLHLVVPTAPTLFRLIEPLRPTLCLDEMEKLDRGDARPIEAIINAGYKAGAIVPRTEGDTKREVVPYEVYAPMALAGIRGLHDVLADRAITIMMQRGLDKTRLNAEVTPTDPAYAAIRAMGYRLALSRWPDVLRGIGAVRARQDSFTILEGRSLELYRPLIAVALLAKAQGEGRFLEDISAFIRDEEDIREGLDPEARWLFGALEGRLRSAPTITVFPKDLTTGFDGPLLTPEQVGRLLKSHGFSPGKRRSGGVPYTITHEHFSEQARRYGYVPEAAQEPEPEQV